jgi:glycerol uptake facilitator-like aquaporin
MRVAAPQSVVLFGAALGGLIAYFIFPRRIAETAPATTRMGDVIRFAATIFKTLAQIAIAMLLSAIVTILLARVSETQCLIRITVADFWGAIAVGFIANYLGIKLFEKIVPTIRASDTTEPKPASVAGPIKADHGVGAPS